MNRQTILASIEQHLRDDFAKTGRARPLGEIVPAVAQEIRSGFVPGPDAPKARVIPIEQVAAFVGGQLSEQEDEKICQAVLTDNSVLAEIIAAVRAGQTSNDAQPPLSNALMSRLMSMSSELPNAQPTPTLSLVIPEHEADPSLVNVTPLDLEQRQGQQANDPTGQEVAEVGVAKTPLNPTVVRWASVAALAVAATIIGVILAVATNRESVQPTEHEIVENTPNELEPNGIEREIPDGPNLEPEGDPVVVAVETPDKNTPPQSPEDVEPVELEKADPDPMLDPVPESIVNDEVLDEEPSMLEIPELIDQLPETPATAPPTRLAAMRWTEISGLLTQQSVPSGTAARRPSWKAVAEREGDLDVAAGAVTLRTLPLSRAQAEIPGGGRIVLAADSGMLVSSGGSRASVVIDLHHGSLALLDLPDGTVVAVRGGDRWFARLKWTEKAAVVLQRAADGLQVHVNRGEVAVNDQPRQAESINVTLDQDVEPIDRPKRLPNWVDRPVDSVTIPRNILAQIADTDNVMVTLNQRINDYAGAPQLNAADQRTLATLAGWQVSMAGPNLFRLISSRVPAVRLAAMQRLVAMSKADSRYNLTWRVIERTHPNKQRVQQIRRWCEMARQGIPPNRSQTEQMVTGLAAQDLAGRAMADFMLRRFFGNQVPAADPTWTGARQQRVINNWRQKLGLPATRGNANGAALSPAAAN